MDLKDGPCACDQGLRAISRAERRRQSTDEMEIVDKSLQGARSNAVGERGRNKAKRLLARKMRKRRGPGRWIFLRVEIWGLEE